MASAAASRARNQVRGLGPVPQLGEQVRQRQDEEGQAGVDVVLEGGPVDARPGQPERSHRMTTMAERQAAAAPGGPAAKAMAAMPSQKTTRLPVS